MVPAFGRKTSRYANSSHGPCKVCKLTSHTLTNVNSALVISALIGHWHGGDLLHGFAARFEWDAYARFAARFQRHILLIALPTAGIPHLYRLGNRRRNRRSQTLFSKSFGPPRRCARFTECDCDFVRPRSDRVSIREFRIRRRPTRIARHRPAHRTKSNCWPGWRHRRGQEHVDEFGAAVLRSFHGFCHARRP